MFCNACGSEISLAAEVCPACGRPVITADVRVEADGVVTVAAQSGVWAPLPETLVATAERQTDSGSINAGDLDQPGFPRDLAGRVALLTGVVMIADLLLPWITVNGAGYSPTGFGLPALALVAALVAVIAPPLIPRLRQAPLTRALPFGVGALSLGFALALWLAAGPLAAALTVALANRITNAAPPELADTVSGQTSSLLQVTPGVGLYIFLLGACALLIAGYRSLTAHGARSPV